MATVRTYDAAALGRVLALWDGHVDVAPALQTISSVNGVALVAGFAADVREFARD